jgi:hypothetical protein
VETVLLIKLAVALKDRSHVRYIFALVQNPRRVGIPAASKYRFRKTLIVCSSSLIATGEALSVSWFAIGQLSGQRQAAGLNTPLSKAVMIGSAHF